MSPARLIGITAARLLRTNTLIELTRGGSFAPKYFGSWTFTIPIRIREATEQRAVRLILIEHLCGPTIRDLCDTSRAATFDVAYRLEILARVLDGYVKQVHKGLDQRDLASRNVVLVFPQGVPPTEQKNTRPRIVLVDYNTAVVSDLTRDKLRRFPTKDRMLPPNPMQVFWNNSLEEFGRWLPTEWSRNDRLRQEWLKSRFGGRNIDSYSELADTA
ncbi:hypothetical protein VTK56DRAFT_5789 [Thermocarpiscus australiensis]